MSKYDDMKQNTGAEIDSKAREEHLEKLTPKQRRERQRELLALEEAREQMHEALVDDITNSFYAIQPTLHGLFGTMQPVVTSWMRHQGFWQSDSKGEKIALMHSELSEMLEAVRKSPSLFCTGPSEHIPDFTAEEEELADLFIRGLDYAGYHNLRLAQAIVAKMVFNLQRPYKHGKTC